MQHAKSNPLLARRLVSLFAGAVLVGLGVSCLLGAGMGAAPYDALVAGVARLLAVPVGTVSWGMAVLCVSAAWLLGRRPRLGTLVSALLVGAVINLALPHLYAGPGILERACESLVGLGDLYLGISLTVSANLGAGAVEELMLGIVSKGPRVRVVRWGMEAVFILLAMLLSGAVGAVTAVFVLATGPVLDWSIRWVSCALGLTGDPSIATIVIE
jgi:uncharacterized membrane protein YczE